MFVRLAFVRQNFHESWCRQLLAIEWHKNPFDKSKNEGASEAGMNLPNLPWNVNITSLKHRSRFGEVHCFRQIIHRIMA